MVDRKDILKIFSVLVLAFFGLQIIAPSISLFFSPQKNSANIVQENVTSNATILEFTNMVRFIPYNSNTSYVDQKLLNFSESGILRYQLSNGFYEIALNNATNLPLVKNELNNGILLSQVKVKSLLDGSVFTLYVSSDRKENDSLVIQYLVSRNNGQLVAVEEVNIPPEQLIYTNQTVQIKDTNSFSLEVYMSDEDQNLVNLMKEFNVTVNYLPLAGKYRFKHTFDTVPNNFTHVLEYIGQNSGEYAITQTINFELPSEFGKLPVSMNTKELYLTDEEVNFTGTVNVYEGIVLGIDNVFMNKFN